MPFIYGTPCFRVLIIVFVVFLWHIDESLVYMGSCRDAFLCLTLDLQCVLALGIRLVDLFPLKFRTGREVAAHTTSPYSDLHFFLHLGEVC